MELVADPEISTRYADELLAVLPHNNDKLNQLAEAIVTT